MPVLYVFAVEQERPLTTKGIVTNMHAVAKIILRGNTNIRKKVFPTQTFYVGVPNLFFF